MIINNTGAHWNGHVYIIWYMYDDDRNHYYFDDDGLHWNGQEPRKWGSCFGNQTSEFDHLEYQQGGKSLAADGGVKRENSKKEWKKMAEKSKINSVG